MSTIPKEFVGPFCPLYPDVILPGFKPLEGRTLAEIRADCRRRVAGITR